MSKTDLIKTYKNLVKPSAEYAVPAWHSMLTAQQSEIIEKQQVQALKNIYGAGVSAKKMREKAGISLLWKRREEASLKFAKKCLVNERCTDCFIERPPPDIPEETPLPIIRISNP